MGADGGVALAVEESPSTAEAQALPTASSLGEELSDWLRDHLTPEIVAAGQAGARNGESLEILRAWNRNLADAGWAAIAWPAEYGGRDASVDDQLAYHEVMAAHGAPGPVNVIGVANIAPAIMAVRDAPSRRRGSSHRCSAARRSGARACRSPMLAPTSLRSGPRPGSKATTSWSTARRPGTAWASTPTGASSTCGPTPSAPKHKGHQLPAGRHATPRAWKRGRCAP